MRDEKRAPLKTPAWEARETRAYPGSAKDLLGTVFAGGKSASRVAWALGNSECGIDFFSSQSPLPQQARWPTSFFVTAHFRTCL